MIEFMLMAAAAQVQVIRLPPMAPSPSPATTASPSEAPAPILVVPQARPGELSVKLLPDLVITQVLVEDDRTAHFKVTNQGTADAKGSIRVSADAYIGTRRGESQLGGGPRIEGLAMGESKWVAISGFSPISEPYYVGKDYSFPLSKATGFSARVDPPVFNVGMLGGGDPLSGFAKLTGSSPPKCYGERGCVLELDENNNGLIVEGDAVGHGKPD